MQVIGLCRFSYPALGGFQTEHLTTQAREAYLYHPERIEERFATFEQITLPSIRAQTDPDFTFLIVTGINMPASLTARLCAMTRDITQIRILPLAPDRHRSAMQRAINSVRKHTMVCAQFRLDDDDAVALDFVAKLRGRATEASFMMAQYNRVAIDFNHGYLLGINAAKLTIAPTRRTLLTAALGLVLRPDDMQCIMNFGHHRLAEYMPVMSFPDPDMFVRGIGRFNDSAEKSSRHVPELVNLTATDDDTLNDRFGIDRHKLAARLRLAKIRHNAPFTRRPDILEG